MMYETHNDIHVKSAPLPINPVKYYILFKVGTCFFSCKNCVAHPFLWGCGKRFIKKIKKYGFWSVLVYILILFNLKNVHCLPMK